MTNSEAIEILEIEQDNCNIEDEEAFELAISALEENDKLKAEIERIKNESHRRSDMFLQEIEQLRSELEQSVNEKQK